MDGPLVIILTLLAWFVPLSIIASGYIRIIYSVKSNLFSPRQDNVISAEVDRARRVREFSFFIYRMMHYYTNFPFLRARPPSKMEGLPLEFIITQYITLGAISFDCMDHLLLPVLLLGKNSSWI